MLIILKELNHYFCIFFLSNQESRSYFSKTFQNYFLGFHSVCASNALIMLRPEEVEQLVCGCPTLDLGELRKVTFYDGYKQDDKTIQHFWEVSSIYRDRKD